MRAERESWEKKQREVGQLATELQNVRVTKRSSYVLKILFFCNNVLVEPFKCSKLIFCLVYDKFAHKHTHLGKNEKLNFPVGELTMITVIIFNLNMVILIKKFTLVWINTP